MNQFVDIIADEQGGNAEQPIVRKLATVGAVYADGVSLIFDGESAASEKHYKANTAIIFAAGDRVKVAEVSGTYVVEYIVGAPGADYPASPLPTGGTTGQVLSKSSNSDYAVQWKTVGVIPTGGTAGQALVKNSDADNDVTWSNISASKVGTDTTYAEMTGYDFAPPDSNSTYPYGLGNILYPWYKLYTGAGSTRLCTSTGKLGFFGAAPISRQTVSGAATVATLITALKNYGLFA